MQENIKLNAVPSLNLPSTKIPFEDLTIQNKPPVKLHFEQKYYY